MQVLIDADNIASGRIALVLTALADLAPTARVVVSGQTRALERTDWSPNVTVVPAVGWQSADIVLAEAYRGNREPLVLVSGDGDFAHLAARHAGPVLVVSGSASRQFGTSATITDPAAQGPGPLREWLSAVTNRLADSAG